MVLKRCEILVKARVDYAINNLIGNFDLIG